MVVMLGSPTLVAFGFPRGWSLKAVRYNGNDITDVATEFKTGRGLEIVLTTRGAEVTGRVPDDAGNPLPGCECRVLMFSADPRRWKNNVSMTTNANVEVQKDGTFTMTGRREGEYLIAAVPEYLSYVPDDASFAPLAKVAERITLLENDRKSIDLHVVKVP